MAADSKMPADSQMPADATLQPGSDGTLRIGFFGGSFDPPHTGHLAVARAARDKFSLDRLLLAPAGQQPLKPAGTSASFADRLAMVDLLCAGEASLESSDVDAPLADGRANYTIDTLQRLRAAVGREASLFVVVGADAFLDLRRWRSPDSLLATADWIVVSRPNVPPDAFRALGLTDEQRRRVHPLNELHVPVSATGIRARLAEGLDTAGELAPAVLGYIQKHHLYSV